MRKVTIKFDIVTALIQLAGRIQVRRVKRAERRAEAAAAAVKATEAALKLAHEAAAKARTDATTEKFRVHRDPNLVVIAPVTVK
ncbi:hypothetical protein UNOSLW4_0115 [Pseudomonas phage UNO-SLW4]|uniref:Uncharacterized protein n=5 Tax=Unosvirus TaxID=3424968 RepID=A0A1B2AN15_9CAUD|nr:hypothetical protein HOS26_gp23 [Pseudomonas phage UNO-SLW1]ANY29038.1 hypothetical protein UNOSLW4_0115 [Pseudomonas phage UNO-SLW4]ANY29085.1 hypothetical protein UNOSLW3_0120 [Pseudomonas phage UNO-SLW3]ANY29131.1 hypothetical protein UNOSLW2_0115 [Pseudomonas phage UNO-SLW2]UBU95719.1 hypothetical protein [Pseudomonas phage PCS4]UPW35217.1 hypothetical protein [Pseudomonas phage PCS5]UZZ63884.1 hypothetical protein PSV6_24 [Pseudomonas phage PSV6]WCD55476.1 hypothetical protein CCNLGM